MMFLLVPPEICIPPKTDSTLVTTECLVMALEVLVELEFLEESFLTSVSWTLVGHHRMAVSVMLVQFLGVCKNILANFAQ